MTPADFQVVCDVSRETLERCAIHLGLLQRWNRQINLVSKASLEDAWGRHFADSAQIWRFRPRDPRLWLDLGSGAGFPGLVIAAIASTEAPGLHIRLVESDQRKAAFLATAAREMGVAVSIDDSRIERLAPARADVVSARALAPLSSLLAMTEKHRRSEGTALFPKGAAVHNEIADASGHWRFEHKVHPSLTEPKAAILEIGAIHRA